MSGSVSLVNGHIDKEPSFTDEEIIKAFEYCTTNEDCSLCPLFRNCPTSFELQKQALDLINRQQADIRKLQLENEKLEIELKSKAEALNKSTNSAMEVIKRQEAEIERLKKGWKADVIETENIKAEAIKEFAERFEEEFFIGNITHSITKEEFEDFCKRNGG